MACPQQQVRKEISCCQSGTGLHLDLLFDQLDWSCSLISWTLALLEHWSSQTSAQPAATMLPPPIQAHCFCCCRCFLQGLSGSLLFDSPGLGKTIQAICLMLANPRSPGACLVSQHTIWVSVQVGHAESLNPTHQPEYHLKAPVSDQCWPQHGQTLCMQPCTASCA